MLRAFSREKHGTVLLSPDQREQRLEWETNARLLKLSEYGLWNSIVILLNSKKPVQETRQKKPVI